MFDAEEVESDEEEKKDGDRNAPERTKTPAQLAVEDSDEDERPRLSSVVVAVGIVRNAKKTADRVRARRDGGAKGRRIRMFCLNTFQFQHAKVFLGFLLFLIVFCFLAYPREDQAREGRGYVIENPNVFNATVPGAPDHYKYGICGTQWRGLDVLDYALLSQLAYVPNKFFSDHLNEWFNASDWEVRGTNHKHDAVTFLDFYSNSLDLSVVSVRGTESLQDAAADAILLLDTIVVQICPLITVLPDVVIRSIIRAVSFPDWLLFPSSDIYYSPLVDYVEKAKKDRDVVLTGHSLGGFLAKFIGVHSNLTAITFASPGLSWSLDKFDLSGENLERIAVTVAAERDLVPAIGKLTGNIQNIQCDFSSPTCHFLTHYICELQRNCGDRRGRPAVVRQCKGWWDHQTKI